MEGDELELQDCPLCHGPAIIEEENGWCVYVTCMDCGAHTGEVPFRNRKEKAEAIRKIGTLWNIGKVLSSNPGE